MSLHCHQPQVSPPVAVAAPGAQPVQLQETASRDLQTQRAVARQFGHSFGRVAVQAQGVHDIQLDGKGVKKPPLEGSTKIDKKNASLTASGKTLNEAITNLTAMSGKGEAGSVTCAPEKDIGIYDAEDGSAPIVYKANVVVTETKAMPVWTELDQQCEPVKKEWNRFYAALDAHENGHLSRDEAVYKDLHKKMLGKDVAAANTVFETAVTDANTKNQEYDTETDHGQKTGTKVNYVQCAPEKVPSTNAQSSGDGEPTPT